MVVPRTSFHAIIIIRRRIIIIITIHRTIFIVLSSTAQSHMQDFTLGPLTESQSAPGGHHFIGQADLRVHL